MNLSIRAEWLKKLKAQGGTEIDELRWRSDERMMELDTNRFTDADLTKLRTIAQKAQDPEHPEKLISGAMGLIRRINLYFKLKDNPLGTPVTNLNALVTAVYEYWKGTKHKWAFKQEKDGEMVPYYVASAHYTPPNERDERPACTTVNLVAICRNDRDTETINFHSTDLGHTIVEMLEIRGYFRETPEMVQDYEAACGIYKEISGKTGAQYLATGTAFGADRYDYGVCEMEVDSEPTRVVMDDLEGDERDDRKSPTNTLASTKFWRSDQHGSEEQELDASDDEDTSEGYAVVPLHPYVKVFDLIKHRHVVIHVNNLAAYAYDQSMIDKLILPAADKELLGIMVQGASEQMEDIVRGKTGGIIVICTGPPGTGKTLTAETFSELVQHPLYCVQCSQLGTSETKLEEKLATVLKRAVRWQAILLIDEADVYVHERGSDICQNAIVGVWLRVLEHYRGILFLTSNRSTIIDDAIMSRATAWIRYDRPRKELLTHIWQVLSTQYQIKLTPAMIEALVSSSKLHHISGRTVKNLCKLTRLLCKRRKTEVSVELIEYVSGYLDIEKDADNQPELMAYPLPMTMAAYTKMLAGMIPGAHGRKESSEWNPWPNQTDE